MEILDNIPFKLELGVVLKKLSPNKENKYLEGIVQELIELVRPVAKPKAVYEVSYVEKKDEDSLEIGGIKFTSRVLRVNLDKVERVFPYIATCGTELDEVPVSPDDFMRYYCLDTIKEIVLRSAISYLGEYLTKKYALGQLSRMSPGSGSVDDWPLAQQRALFSIFGEVEDLIGVRLTEHLVMIPLKSVSGICFPTQIKFESCQLCPREACIGRRAPYNPDLAKKYRSAAL